MKVQAKHLRVGDTLGREQEMTVIRIYGDNPNPFTGVWWIVCRVGRNKKARTESMPFAPEHWIEIVRERKS